MHCSEEEKTPQTQNASAESSVVQVSIYRMFPSTTLPWVHKALGCFGTSGGAGEATQVSASCSFIQCISKAGVGVCQLTRETVNKYRRKLWSFRYILVL